MHHDPLISSRAKPLTSWGHDWVVLTLIVRCPFWAPTKVWSLPIAFRLYRNRQGVTKGKKKPKGKPQKQGGPQPPHPAGTGGGADFPGGKLVSRREICSSAATAPTAGQSVLQKLPANVELISHVHPEGRVVRTGPGADPRQEGGAREEGTTTARHGGLGRRSEATLAEVGLRPVRSACHAAGQDDPGVVLQGGQGSAVDDRPGPRRVGQTARSDVLLHAPGLGTRERFSRHTPARWSIEVTFENCKQLLGLEDPANRKEKAVRRTAPMALVLYSLIVAWFHQVGHRHLQFPDRPWYRTKEEPSFADMLTTLRRLSWQDKIRTLPSKSRVAKKILAQLIEFLSLAG